MRPRANFNDLLVFYQGFIPLIQAGMPIVPALRIMLEEVKNKHFKEAIKGMADDISKGEILSTAMKKYPHIFDLYSVNIVKAAEQAGTLDIVSVYILDSIQKNVRLQKRIRGNLLYPIAWLIAFFTTGVLLISVASPFFAQFLTYVGIVVPSSPPRIIITIATYLARYWYFVLIPFVSLWVALMVTFHTIFPYRWTPLIINRIILRLPILGPLSTNISIARFLRTLHILISYGGVLGFNALLTTKELLINSAVQQKLPPVDSKNFKEKYHNSISEYLHSTGILSPSASSLLRIADKEGSLGSKLIHIANLYQERAHSEVETLATFAGTLFKRLLLILFTLYVAYLVWR